MEAVHTYQVKIAERMYKTFKEKYGIKSTFTSWQTQALFLGKLSFHSKELNLQNSVDILQMRRMWELDGQNEEESWKWDQSQDRKVDLEFSQLSQWDDPKGMEEPVTHQYRQVPSIQENVFGHRGVGFLKENM